MRGLTLLLPLFITGAVAATEITVPSNGVVRLAGAEQILSFERLQVAEQGTLLIPAGVSELRVTHLGLDVGARLGIAPSDQPLNIVVEHASIAERSSISAHGAPGSPTKLPTPGRELHLNFGALELDTLLIDVRGGRGLPGFNGQDGADGDQANCTWGAASSGERGQDAGDGQHGAAGGVVKLAVPAETDLERIAVLLEGGSGGPAGMAGQAGLGGSGKDCLVYRASGAADGTSGREGLAGSPGPAGRLDIVQN